MAEPVLLDELLDLLGEVKCIHDDAIDAVRTKPIDVALEEWATTDVDQHFRDALTECSQTGTEARCQNHRVHG